MSETARIWTETSFNIFYLIIVWWLVISMYNRRSLVAQSDQRTARLFIWAFFFLGLGDIGHVGFRVVAYALGGLEASVTIFGQQLTLAPMGAQATAITFTFFYAIMVMIWHARFNKEYGWCGYFLFALALLRLVLMTHPSNAWNNVEPQQPWALYRNIPLMLMQLGVAFLILRDAVAQHDRTFIWIGVMILVSFICYAPVIFFHTRIPLIGMLMIPKTIAYLVIAFLGFFKFYKIRPLKRTATTFVSP